MSAPEQIFFAVGLVIIGACFGSFLNVVVYRLPAGLSLSRPPSHCPCCHRPIRKQDNIPIVGWWLLGGRCRDCRQPIPARYPRIEGFTSAMFLAVGVVHILGQPPVVVPAATTLLERYAWLIATAFDLTLLCTLLVATVIACDGHRAPPRLFGFALGVGVVARFVLPVLGHELFAAAMPYADPILKLRLSQLLLAALGGGAGLVLGTVISGTSRDRCSVAIKLRNPLVAQTALIGLYWGWFAVAILVAWSLLAQRLFNCRKPLHQIPTEVWLFAGAVAYPLLLLVLTVVDDFPALATFAWLGP